MYRAKWAQEKYAWVEASRSMTEQYSKVSLEVGEMMTFGELVQSYGGWEWSEAVEGAKAHVAKCARMGGSWVQRDEFFGLWHFMKLKKVHQELLEQQWKVFTRWHNGEFAPVPDGSGGSASTHATAKQTKRAIANVESSTPTKGGRSAKAPDAPKSVLAIYKEAQRMKAQHFTVIATADAAIARINSGEAAYSWASGKVVKEMEATLARYLSTMTAGDKELLLHDWKSIKESKTEERLAGELEDFVCRVKGG